MSENESDRTRRPVVQPFPTPAIATAPRRQDAASAGSSTEHADEARMADYVRVLFKRRWTAASTFLIVIGSITIYTFTATPVYEARVRLLIETENPNVVAFQEVIEQNKSTTDYYQTQYRILESRALAQRTLENGKLWAHPEFSKEPGTVSRAWTASTRALNGLIGRGSVPAPAAGAEKTRAHERAIDRLLENLTVAPVRNSRLIDVKYESADPALTMLVANAHARAYIDQNLEFKFLATKEASDWLANRMAEQRKQLEAGELALQQYREDNDAISLEDRQNIIVQRLADVNAAVTRARTTRIEKEALFNQLRNIQTKRDALDTFPAILSNVFVQQLKAELAGLQRQQAELGDQLGERHPDMIKLRSALRTAEAKLQAEVAKVVQSIGNEYRAARDQERDLTIALEQQKTEALAMNRKAIEYGVLQRDSSSSRQMFEELLQRAKQTEISGELKTSNIRVVDPASLPETPARPRPLTNLLFGLFGGAVLAVGLAFCFEGLDNRIKTPDEIKRVLSVPFLGMIPSLPKGKGEAMLLNESAAPSGFVEAFRAIRTNVLFSSADEGCRTVVVTSTRPGEGKTLVAANLAIALAQSGHRVLLFDGDLRKPRVHEVFDRPLEPGVSNLMVGRAKASEAMQKSDIPGLWLLPAGRIPPNPAELLGSKRFKDFQFSLRQHFDWIIIDSPPVMAVTDPSILAHAADGVIFVVGSEMTARSVALSAIDQLESSNAHIVGAILNRVDIQRNSYYYSQYYRREYVDYYTPRPAAAAGGKR
jgi:capsular exopolysaccharide synthesis family protein